MNGIFVTGTDTSVGKTHVTCLLARCLRERGIRVGIYKPVCSGAEVTSDSPKGVFWPDVAQLSVALDNQFPAEWICPQQFIAPLAPPVAAAREGRAVDAGQLRRGVDIWRDNVDLLLIEGAGGWRAPVTDSETVAELATDLGFPVLLVSANRLGMVSHTLLTIESIQSRGLTLCGVVVNPVQSDEDESRETNPQLLGSFTDVPVFGPLTWMPDPWLVQGPLQELIPLVEHCTRKGWFPRSPI